jgi:hypothetical protein
MSIRAFARQMLYAELDGECIHYARVMQTWQQNTIKYCTLKVLWPREQIVFATFDKIRFLTQLPDWVPKCYL